LASDLPFDTRGRAHIAARSLQLSAFERSVSAFETHFTAYEEASENLLGGIYIQEQGSPAPEMNAL
jgi:hypothetical protein